MASDGCSGNEATSSSQCASYTYDPPSPPLPGDASGFFADVSSLLSTNPKQLNYGIAVTDTNGNGLFEFVVAGYGAANQAFEWDGSSFFDVALGSSTLRDASSRAIGVAACDIDGDGHEELYVLNTDRYSGTTTTSDRLIARNASTGSHVELFGLSQNQNSANFVAGRSCACVDRNDNGRFAVMVANYGGPMRLFEAEADGTTIVDRASEANVDKTTGGRALVAGPILTEHMDIFANNEGWTGGGRRLEGGTGGGRRLESDEQWLGSVAEAAIDAEERATAATASGEVEAAAEEELSLASRVAQRRLSHRANFMFRNDGDGTFSDVAGDVGILDNDLTGRGTSLFDANGDGLIDIVYGNWNAQHRLYLQSRDASGNAQFTDVAPAAMAEASPIRTVIVADFDNDGYEEIFWNNIPGNNRLFRKLPTDSDWTQVSIGDAAEPDGHGTGGAVGDLDGDGILELLVSHGESRAQPLSLYRPRASTGAAANHWLRVLPKTVHGSPARGALVRLHMADGSGRTQLRVIDAGSGYLCQMEPVAHFGLGSATAVASLDVVWPGGVCVSVASPAVDQMHTVTYPVGRTAADGCDGNGAVLAYANVPGGNTTSSVRPPPPLPPYPPLLPSQQWPPPPRPLPPPSPTTTAPPLDSTEQAVTDANGDGGGTDVAAIVAPIAVAVVVLLAAGACCYARSRRKKEGRNHVASNATYPESGASATASLAGGSLARKPGGAGESIEVPSAPTSSQAMR